MKQSKLARLFAATACVGMAMTAGLACPCFGDLPPGTGLPAAPKTAAAAAAVPASQPSMDEVQAAMDAKQYPAAVKAASKLLSLHGPAAAGINRYDLTMTKGYAQAGMKSVSSAIISFKAAEKETKDTREISLAKWTAELFKIAGGATYTPKMNSSTLAGTKRGPFDLMVAEQRKDAFGALLDDNLAALEPKLKTATVSQNLTQIWPVLQQVVDLDQLDVIANGSDDKTTQMAGALLEHARNLLTNALKADWARVSDIDTHANQTTTVPTQTYINNQVVTQNVTKKNGLTDSNKSELKNIISVCQKVHDAAQTFMAVAKTDKDWSTILSDADRVAGRCSDILSADYGTSTSTGSTIDLSNTGTGTGGFLPGTQYPNNIRPGQTTPTTPVTPTTPRSNAPVKPKPKGTGT